MFNIKKIGVPIAQVKDGSLHGEKIYFVKNRNNEVEGGENIIKLKNGKFQQIPYYNVKEEITRRIWYITGPSGSGKSVYVRNTVLNWRKLNPAFKNVYMFSALTKDKNLDSVGLRRCTIDDSLISDPLVLEDFENSMLIFDDIDAITNEKHKEAIYKFLDQALITGRHHNISVMMTNHDIISGKNTKRILGETHYIVYFPHKSPKKKIEYLLENYVDMDLSDVRKIKNFDKSEYSWCCISKTFPKYALMNQGLFGLDILDDDDNETF